MFINYLNFYFDKKITITDITSIYENISINFLNLIDFSNILHLNFILSFLKLETKYYFINKLAFEHQTTTFYNNIIKHLLKNDKKYDVPNENISNIII